MTSILDNLSGCKKRKLNGDTAALGLVLESPSVPVKKPRLGSHPCLHVDDCNYVLGSVNGTTCRVQLDSGSSITVLFWNMAKRLGLITGQEPTITTEIDLWLGPKKLEVVELESVTIDLGSGVVVVTPAIVFPEWLEPHYDAEDVVLDAHLLRRGRMVQVFRPDGSDIFLRKPEQLLRKIRKSQRVMKPDVLRVKLAHSRKRKTMTMLVDTGAVGIHVSGKRRKLLTQGSKMTMLPSRVVLDVGDGCCLHAEPLENVPADANDFIIGTSLLRKYNTVLDYHRYTLTFLIDSQWRKVTMETRLQALHVGNKKRKNHE